MSESEKFNPDEKKEVGFDVEKSNEIRGEYLDAVELYLKDEFEERFPKIPESNRKLESLTDAEGHVVAQYNKVREHKPVHDGNDKWFIVDFDDVINHTTEFNNEVRDFVMSNTGMTAEEFKEIYDFSKIKNDKGKSVLRFEELKKQVEERHPGTTEKINQFLESVDYNQYIDQGIKRALMAIKSDKATRISILTFGDLDYQSMRINNTDLDDIVDDIIYTEGSKRETLQAVEKKLYQKETKEGDWYHTPFKVVVDDSVAHVEDYDEHPDDKTLLNIHYSNPRAKRHGEKSGAGHIWLDEETSANQAAINLWKMSKEFSGQNRQSNDNRDDVYRGLDNITSDPERFDEHLMRSPWVSHLIERDISYQTDDNSHIIRSSKGDNFGWSYYPESKDRYWDKAKLNEHDCGKIDENGKLVDFNRRPDINFEEFIKQAK